MSQYEVLVASELDADNSETIKKSMAAVTTKLKAKIVKSEDWGERSLSYPIKKQDRAWYSLFTLELKPETVKKFNTNLTLEKGILRYLVTKIN